MKRLFFALWPDEAIRRQCGKIVENITGEGLRPVAAMNLHVTLLFLGGIDATQEAAITAAAEALSVPPAMELRFDKLSYWSKPGILCLTGRCFDREITALAEQLTAIAVRYGVTVDERPFKPHVTLVRKAKSAAVVEFEPILWRADAVCLVESCSTTDGVEYRVIKRWAGEQPDNAERSSN